jgi:predicted transposase/invertase (TIGR01784 family)
MLHLVAGLNLRLTGQFRKNHQYAVATTDTAFKHMLSLSLGSRKDIVISFLNAFVPSFRGNPVVDVEEAPVAIPAVRKVGEKQTFMDLHVIASSGAHYIVEMQARRHVMFDERCLYYACSTYSRQLSERDLSDKDWYKRLKPTVALQILDYDSNRARGLQGDDSLIFRVKDNPLKTGEYTKHYQMLDKTTGQTIDHLQMVQVELPRAEEAKTLFPPHRDFTIIEWWLSLLKHSNDYTEKIIREMVSAKVMPHEVFCALERLDLSQWNPQEIKEYKEDLTDKSSFASMLEAERKEGRREARLELVRTMKKLQTDVEVIMKITGMSRAEIDDA